MYVCIIHTNALEFLSELWKAQKRRISSTKKERMSNVTIGKVDFDCAASAQQATGAGREQSYKLTNQIQIQNCGASTTIFLLLADWLAGISCAPYRYNSGAADMTARLHTQFDFTHTCISLYLNVCINIRMHMYTPQHTQANSTF